MLWYKVGLRPECLDKLVNNQLQDVLFLLRHAEKSDVIRKFKILKWGVLNKKGVWPFCWIS